MSHLAPFSLIHERALYLCLNLSRGHMEKINVSKIFTSRERINELRSQGKKIKSRQSNASHDPTKTISKEHSRGLKYEIFINGAIRKKRFSEFTPRERTYELRG